MIFILPIQDHGRSDQIAESTWLWGAQLQMKYVQNNFCNEGSGSITKDGAEILQVLKEQEVCCEIESPGNIIEAASTRLHKPGCLSKDNTTGHANMERRNSMDHNSRVLPAGKLEILRVGAIAFCSFFVLHINSIPGVRHSTFWTGQSTTPVPFSSSCKTKTIKDL